MMPDSTGPRRRATALRCAICSTDWPLEKRYRICPECDEETFGSEEDPIERHEAQKRFIGAMYNKQQELNRRHQYDLFEEYYRSRRETWELDEEEVRQFTESLDRTLATILGKS